MLPETRRPLIGRIALGALALGASLSITACGQLPLLPPALTGSGEVSPEPVDTASPEETASPDIVGGETSEPAGAEDTGVFQIYLGDCLNEAVSTGEGISEVPKIDCAEPHDQEVYHVEDIAEPGAFPGQEEIGEMATTMCRDAFEGFVGIPYVESALDHTSLSPTAGGWDTGDREVLCMVYDPAGKVEGSLAGSGR